MSRWNRSKRNVLCFVAPAILAAGVTLGANPLQLPVEFAQVTPAPDSRGVTPDARIEIVLESPLDPAVVAQGRHQIMLGQKTSPDANEFNKAIPGKLSYDERTRTLIYQPDSPLEPDENYVVMAMVFTGPGGMKPVQFVWFFDTQTGLTEESAQGQRYYIIPYPGVDNSDPQEPRLSLADIPISIAERQKAAAGVRRSPPSDPETQAELDSLIARFLKQPKTGGLQEDFEQILRTENSEADIKSQAALYLGWTLGYRGSHYYMAEAEKFMRYAVELRPDYAEAHVGLGVVLKYRFQLHEGNQELLRALQINPNLYKPYVYLHFNYNWMERMEEAEEALNRALQVAPTQREVWIFVSRIHAAEERPVLQMKAMMKAAEAPPQDAEFWYEVGKDLYRNGRFSSSRTAVENALGLGLESAGIWALVGELFSRDGDFTKSTEAYRKALALDPALRATWRSLRLAGQAWEVRKSTSELAAHLDHLQAEFGASAASQSELGFLFALEKNWEESANRFIRAFELDTEGSVTYITLGEVAKVIGVDFNDLGIAILTRNPELVRVKGMVQQFNQKRAEAEAEERTLAAEIAASPWNIVREDRVYGENLIGQEVYEARRDYWTQQAGNLGALGLIVVPEDRSPYNQ